MPGTSYRVDIQLIFNHNKGDLLMINEVNIFVGKIANLQLIGVFHKRRCCLKGFPECRWGTHKE